MSVKHYRQPTAAERKAAERKAKEDRKKTPAQKKRDRTMSTPAKLKIKKK